ncbi:MAG: flagellar biosynthesis protein FlhA [Pirellulales bacterium]|nr:flagellar biosynthesis protein FlhA [Pirellulales bacterium]
MATVSNPRADFLGSAQRAAELILPIGVVASVLVIIVPMYAGLMSLLLSANITVAVIILLTTIYVKTPLEFSIFPSLLLATTLARLVLNVATTRLILTGAETEGLYAAGGVVRAFGEFVAGDKVVVGLIIFVIIVVIQFVVITKGATRISEVAARFALDGMPGRQMAIDADLNAGLIDEHEARRRREEITAQADFFAAMDGASKFVRGDAIAGIVITLINILGGLFIGVVQTGMSVGEAAELFTKLTIGDGLVSQVPALLICLAAGLLVTRSTTATNLPGEFVHQLLRHPQTLVTAGLFLGLLAFTSLPRFPLLLLGSICVALAIVLSRRTRQTRLRSEADRVAREAVSTDQRVEDCLTTSPIEFELGLGLLRLADPRRGGDLMQRIQNVRRSIATDLGIILPKVRMRDNLQLPHNEYRIKLDGIPIAGGQISANQRLAIDAGNTTGQVPGTSTVDPVSGSRALWIDSNLGDQAERCGYTVVLPGDVLANHLTALVHEHADELLTRDATKHLIDELKQTSPAVVDELVPSVMKLAEVQQILQMLLREQVPIRQLGVILEALGECALRTKDPTLRAEHVRSRLARTLCSAHRDPENRLHLVTLDPALADRIHSAVEHDERGMFIRMSPQVIEEIGRLIATKIELLTEADYPPVLLVDPQIRPAVRRITELQIPKLTVLSYNEITRDTKLESVAMVGSSGIGDFWIDDRGQEPVERHGRSKS